MYSAGDEGFVAIAVVVCAAGKVPERIYVSHERGVGHTPRWRWGVLAFARTPIHFWKIDTNVTAKLLFHSKPIIQSSQTAKLFHSEVIPTRHEDTNLKVS